MQIDWLTVAAQIVNFLVLVWLLQRFLYRPISEAMRRRETRIEERLAEAKAARADAEEEAERLRRKRQELEEAKDDILDKAHAEAAELRKQIEADLRAEIEEKRETWRRHLEDERDEFARTLQRRAGHKLLDIVARVLAEFADADLSERIAGSFVARLEKLDENTRDRLSAAAGRWESATVETGHPLGSSIQGRITRALHEAFSTDISVEYGQDEDLVLGVRLTIGEQTLEWSAERHLKKLAATLDEVLETAGHSVPGGRQAERLPDEQKSPA